MHDFGIVQAVASCDGCGYRGIRAAPGGLVALEKFSGTLRTIGAHVGHDQSVYRSDLFARDPPSLSLSGSRIGFDLEFSFDLDVVTQWVPPTSQR